MIDPFLVAAKQAQKDKLGKAIELKMGRKPANVAERRKRSAATDLIAGDSPADVERRYAIAQGEVENFIKKVFPSDEERFEFLENAMLANATLASAKFVKVYDTMTAVEAATSAVKFAGAAIAIKQAREKGFKETPINVGIILQLQETISKLNMKETKDIDES